MLGRPPSMPTTPPGNATHCHEGDRRGGKGRPSPGGGVGPSLGTYRESATAGRERVFSARASPLYLKPSWRALRASSGVPLDSCRRRGETGVHKPT